jgi:rubredoxin
MNAMCAMGAALAKRRCDNGKSIKAKCIPAITSATIQWPMAVSIWRLGGSDDLEAAVSAWRSSTLSGHVPNIEWDKHTPGTVPAHPWKGPMPTPGEVNPSSMPQPGAFPSSKDAGWGSPKIAKVVKCSDIPSEYKYNTDTLFYCDRLNTTSGKSFVDEAYMAWKSLVGVWPPTKPCADDLTALNASLAKIAPPLAGSNCSVVLAALKVGLPNFDCDNSDIFTAPTFRNMCCSVCGGSPIPDVPPPTPAPPGPPAAPPYHCSVCNHVYDSMKDGGGKAFEDLPNDWVCPVCGAPKAAYYQQTSGEWAHA